MRTRAILRIAILAGTVRASSYMIGQCRFVHIMAPQAGSHAGCRRDLGGMQEGAVLCMADMGRPRQGHLGRHSAGGGCKLVHDKPMSLTSWSPKLAVVLAAAATMGMQACAILCMPTLGRCFAGGDTWVGAELAGAASSCMPSLCFLKIHDHPSWQSV